MAMYIDEYNGDADGLCAVVQCRLHEPQAAQGDKLLVCDLSMRRNRLPLMRLLEARVSVRYFDHHKVDDIPVHPLLDAHIDVAGDTCTNLLEPFIEAFSATQWRDAPCVPGDS